MRENHAPALVSVIIPTYNRSDLLRLTVESVLAQTYPNIEIIVVDDGSTDDTATVMAQYTHRVTYIKQANQGGAAGRNAGFQAASGEYINFLDHDDLMLPTKIERQVRVLDSRPEVGLVHCGYYHIDKDGHLLEKVSSLPEGTLKELVCGDFIWSGAPLIRRQCLERVGGFDGTAPCSDSDMWFRIAQANYQFACVQEPLGAYRILQDSQMVRVDKLEHGEFAILDKVFADSQLPADVIAVKERVYGHRHFWIGCRYYEIGRWEDAQRNMSKAFALHPHLLRNPEQLLHELSDNALDLRVSDPIKFVANVFDHLPPEAENLSQYRARLNGRVYVGLALRNFGTRDNTEAKRLLAEAVSLDPTMLNHSDAFAGLLSHYALRLPVSEPLHYLETVFQNLPANALPLRRLRSRVMSDVQIGCAFQDYFAGHRQLAARRILRALRYRPSWFLNRGVVSIFLRSLLGLLYSKQPKVSADRLVSDVYRMGNGR